MLFVIGNIFMGLICCGFLYLATRETRKPDQH